MDMGAIVILICILAVTGVMIYYLAYQRHLRKALKDPAAARHQNLPAPDNAVAAAAVILGFAVLLLISSNIKALTGSIEDLNKDLNNKNAYSYELSNIENEIKQQRSIIAYYDIDDSGSEIKISIIPKTVSKETKVTVNYDNVSVVLTREEGAKFSGILPFTERDVQSDYIVSIETNGIIETEFIS